jgi:hypothetical protein
MSPAARRAPGGRAHSPRRTGQSYPARDLIPTQEDPYAGLAEAPPPISGYREANVDGMACWNCAHFTPVEDADGDGIPEGVCNLFEAKVDGAATCDRFTAHADLYRQSPHTSWQEDMYNDRLDPNAFGPSVAEVDYSDNSSLASIHLAGSATEENGLVWKDILRTGDWSGTPTGQGILKKHLRIIRDGESDPENGIISLSELSKHFDEGAVPYVTVPLSDDERDHKNIARLNTGFVRQLRVIDRGDGLAVLRAGIDFTEPDIKGKVLRGSIPDVSAGIPFNVVRRSDDRIFKTVLDHVCLTRKPFVDKLVPFGIAAADGDVELPVQAFESEVESPDAESSTAHAEDQQEAPPTTPPESSPEPLSFRRLMREIKSALNTQLQLGPDYIVEDITGQKATIFHRISQTRWEVEYETEPLRVAPIDKWEMIDQPVDENGDFAASTSPKLTDLQRARELRELRLSQPTSTGGIQMSTLSLDGVELSALPEEARAHIQSILDENATLRGENRESKVNSRVEELKNIPGLNLADRPGALKLYRQVMLADDGGPAVILFSDGEEEKREPLTALAILDRFIDGLKAGAEVQLSDQHYASGNDTKPPRDASKESKPLDERVADTKEALYGKRNRRK